MAPRQSAVAPEQLGGQARFWPGRAGALMSLRPGGRPGRSCRDHHPSRVAVSARTLVAVRAIFATLSRQWQAVAERLESQWSTAGDLAGGYPESRLLAAGDIRRPDPAAA